MQRPGEVMFKVFALVLTALLFSYTPTVNAQEQKVFEDRVLNAIGKLPSGWDRVVFEDVRHRSIRLTLVYRSLPSSLEQVKNDTHRIARAVLKVLVDNGRNPSQEMIAVFVHGQIPEKGETGASMVRYFGKTMYDFNNDQLAFKPAK